MNKEIPGCTWKGQAVFVPLQSTLWDIRQAAKQAIHEGQEERSFVVTDEMIYLPTVLPGLLWREGGLEEEVQPILKNIQGEKEGALRCAALWNMEEEGMLLHEEKGTLICTFLPLLTISQAQKEYRLSQRLAALAAEVGDSMIYLERPIPAGHYLLAALLRELAKKEGE